MCILLQGSVPRSLHQAKVHWACWDKYQLYDKYVVPVLQVP